MLNKQYEIQDNTPDCIDWENYKEQILKNYYDLLSNKQNNENVFQKFFEENPSFVPGAFEIFGESGHYPFMETIISQPDIGTIFQRKPDFVWLAQDSLTFSPVFVEIEKPSKKMFNKNKTTTADFNQALNQIHQWKYILDNPTNVQVLKDYFSLPTYIRDKVFKPQFLLIYGRREEYQNDNLLTGIRAEHKTDNIDIISFDRLEPSYKCQQIISCKISQGNYNVINIPPTYRYRPDIAEDLAKLHGFKDKINDMKYTSEERKNFLKERYQYWYDFGKSNPKGILDPKDNE